MPVRFVDFFRKLGRILLLRIKNGDIPVFLLFLMLALFMWWSHTMGGTFDFALQYPVEVAGLDKNDNITRPLTSPVRVSVTGQGTLLWRESRRKRVLKIPVSAFQPSVNGSSSVSSTVLMDTLSSLLPTTLTVRSIYPDSLRFSYVTMTEIMLPIRFAGNPVCADRYRVDEIKTDPERVAVRVPADMTETFDAVYTDTAGIEVGSGEVSARYSLVSPKGAVLQTNEVTVTVKASQVTEKSTDVRVTGINIEDGLQLRTFPSVVRLMFQVRLSDFEEVDAYDFVVGIDCSSMDTSGDKAEVEVFQQPSNVYNVRISPQIVEYLFEKREYTP